MPEEAEKFYSDLLTLVGHHKTVIIHNSEHGWDIVAKELSEMKQITDFTSAEAVIKFENVVGLHKNAFKKYQGTEKAQAN